MSGVIKERTGSVQRVVRNGVSVELIITIEAPRTENGRHVTMRMGVLEALKLGELLTATAEAMIDDV